MKWYWRYSLMPPVMVAFGFAYGAFAHFGGPSYLVDPFFQTKLMFGAVGFVTWRALSRRLR